MDHRPVMADTDLVSYFLSLACFVPCNNIKKSTKARHFVDLHALFQTAQNITMKIIFYETQECFEAQLRVWTIQPPFPVRRENIDEHPLARSMLREFCAFVVC